MYKPTIHHGYLLEKNRHPGRQQGHKRRPLPPVPSKSSGGICSILFILINILFILINPSCTLVLVVSQHKQQSTIIWLGITQLGSARLSGEMLFYTSNKFCLLAVCPKPKSLELFLDLRAQTHEKITTKTIGEGTKMSCDGLTLSR